MAATNRRRVEQVGKILHQLGIMDEQHGSAGTHARYPNRYGRIAYAVSRASHSSDGDPAERHSLPELAVFAAILDDLATVYGAAAIDATKLAEAAEAKLAEAKGEPAPRRTVKIANVSHRADGVVGRHGPPKYRQGNATMLGAVLEEAVLKEGTMFVFSRASLIKLLSDALDADVELG